MDFFKHYTEVTNIQFILYNLVIFAIFVYLLYKYRKSSVSQYLLFLFTIGFWSDVSDLLSIGNVLLHLHKGVIFFWAIILLYRYKFQNKDINLFLFFIPFFFYFIFVSIWVHNDNIGLVVSQVLRYVIPILSLFVMDGYVGKYQQGGVRQLNFVFKDIIVAQIFFCFAKLVLIQAALEGWVGSMTGIRGGGAGTSFPLLCLLWLAINTRMEFSRKNILYAVGFLFIGFMTGKRAIWLLFPLLYMILLMVYRMRNIKQMSKYLLPTIVLGSIFFYFGLRLSPTLNPEHKVWGAFDPIYAYEYALKYSGGETTESGQVQVNEGDGRLGAVVLFWNDLVDISHYNKVVFWGRGNESIKYYDKSKYSNREANFGVSYRGGITRIVFMYFSIGIIGVLLFFIYFIPILCRVRNIRMRWVVIGTVLFDFIFYNGQIVENFAMQSMLLFIVVLLRFRLRGEVYRKDDYICHM